MTLHQIRIFVTVARYLNMTKASQELHVSQPALSRQLKVLEQEYDAEFYVKTNKGVELTEKGRGFLEAIRPILTQSENIERVFKSNLNARKSSLAVGGSRTLSVTVLPEVLVAFKQTYPWVDVILDTHDSWRIEQGILNSETEIALIANTSNFPLLAYEPYRKHELVAFARSKEIFGQSRMTLETLAKVPLVVRKGCRSLREFSKRGYDPNLAVECRANECVKAAVLKGLGVGILFRESVENEPDLKIINVPELKTIDCRSYIIYDKNKPLTPLAQAFLQLLRERRTSSVNSAGNKDWKIVREGSEDQGSACVVFSSARSRKRFSTRVNTMNVKVGKVIFSGLGSGFLF
jgi:LysR family transcriptional regulator, low CO2-responsive transcriptional regulator